MDREPPQHVPLRRRKLKACDQCRYTRRRCNHDRVAKRCQQCEKWQWPCTYDTPSVVCRNGKYVARLEQKVRRLEDEIALSQAQQQNVTTSVAQDVSPVLVDVRALEFARLTPTSPDATVCAPEQPSTLEAMPCPSTSLLGAGYLGDAIHDARSGLEVLRCLRVHMDSLAGLDYTTDDPAGGIVLAALERSIALDLLKTRPLAFYPSRITMLDYINIAFTEVFSLWPVSNRARVDDIVFRLHACADSGYTSISEDEMALLYAILALGERFEWAKIPATDPELYGRHLKGLAYVKAAQSLVSPSKVCRSVTALHAMMCLTLYLITASAHALAYVYLSTSILAAMTIDLDNSNTSCFPSNADVPIDKVTYQTLRSLDNYLSGFLGFPRSKLLPSANRPGSLLSLVGCSYRANESLGHYAEAHDSILQILGEVQHDAFYIDIAKENFKSSKHCDEFVAEMREKFRGWYNAVRVLIEPTTRSTSTQSFRLRLHLQYTYACVRMIAYAPFLPFVLRPKTGNANESRYLAGSLCVLAAVQASQIAWLMESHAMFNISCTLSYNGPIFAASILLTVQLSAPHFPVTEVVSEASRQAESTLNQLARRDAAASACAESFKPLYGNAMSETSTHNRAT